MVQIGKIYTRRGDAGETDLVDGGAVPKTDPRVAGMGAIDELNAAMGMLRTVAVDAWPECDATLQRIQSDLFDMGGIVGAAPDSAFAQSASFDTARVPWLEGEIDALRDGVPDLTSFVLPGGTEINARAHMARTIGRRAEREMWALNAQSPVDAEILKYLNRLSDYCFAFARWATYKADGTEYLWEPRIQSDDG